MTPWKIDEAHSSIHFSVRHLVVATLRGQFRRFRAELDLDDADLTRSSVVLTIEAGSIDTGNANRDATLRSARFFDADKFPTVVFRSRRLERVGTTAYRVIGDLTILSVTREIALDAELGGYITDARGARRAGFTISGNLERSAFGMTWNQLLEAGGVAISDRVALLVELEAMAQVAQAA